MFFAMSSPTQMTGDKFLLGWPMDSFPQTGCDNDYLGTSDADLGIVHPETQSVIPWSGVFGQPD
jgi:hypothetical protein